MYICGKWYLFYFYAGLDRKELCSFPSRPANRRPRSKTSTKYHLPHIYILPPDDGLQMGPKHVEVR
jgi:hypothetical protein